MNEGRRMPIRTLLFASAALVVPVSLTLSDSPLYYSFPLLATNKWFRPPLEQNE